MGKMGKRMGDEGVERRRGRMEKERGDARIYIAEERRARNVRMEGGSEKDREEVRKTGRKEEMGKKTNGGEKKKVEKDVESESERERGR